MNQKVVLGPNTSKPLNSDIVKYYRVVKDVTGTVTDSDKEFSKFGSS